MRAVRWALALVLLLTAPALAGPFDPARLNDGGYALMVRHAQAPGIGDPEGFTIGDCSTQRNLDDLGRGQARAIGERLRAAGIKDARVYSSQWCRCLETARLMDVGPVHELPALNSFFGRAEARETSLMALRAFLADQPMDGPPIVLVTHQVTIRAITGEGAVSGEAKVLELDLTGAPPLAGTLAAP